MFLTDEHLIVARDGAHRRPRTGFRAIGLDTIQHLWIELGRRSGRIVVSTAGSEEALSMFFHVRSLERAQELLDVARPLLARSRRRRKRAERAVQADAPESPSSPDTRARSQ
jgi:hypothetical protein